MTRPLHAFRYLLLLALLAGQWAYAEHSHHDDEPGSDHHCQFCLHSAQFDALLPTATLKPAVPAHRHVLIATLQASCPTFFSRFHDSRAPPHS
jgi:hypothetical protein